MRIGPCVESLDPYAWVPGHGESSMTLTTCGNDLIVAVAYDDEDESSEHDTIACTAENVRHVVIATDVQLRDRPE